MATVGFLCEPNVRGYDGMGECRIVVLNEECDCFLVEPCES